MRIAFAHLGALDFTVESAYSIPLGGSESAMCYLSEALAKQGHEIFLLSGTSQPLFARGVHCLPVTHETISALRPLDAFVVQNCAGCATDLKPLLAHQTRFLLWTQHAINQSDVRALHDSAERDAYDGFALVSDWQRKRYIDHFHIDPERSVVLRNAIGPSFRDLFPSEAPILAHKSATPILAYTSTPFRGLDVLLELFPLIRHAIPEARLRVFSSMQVYQYAEHVDRAQYGLLYHRCQTMDGVDYVGSLSQPALVRELRSVSMLAYPNTFAETSCIAVMEAMAAGCWIVTSELGALPETTAGFGRLVPIPRGPDADYQSKFVDAVVETLERTTDPHANEAESHLHRQVRNVNESCIWPLRAREWTQWLSSIRPRDG